MAGVTRNTCLNSQPVSRVANHSTLASTAHTIPASWPMPVPRSTKITAIARSLSRSNAAPCVSWPGKQAVNREKADYWAWEREIDCNGVPGLRTTRYQIYRDTDIRRGQP